MLVRSKLVCFSTFDSSISESPFLVYLQTVRAPFRPRSPKDTRAWHWTVESTCDERGAWLYPNLIEAQPCCKPIQAAYTLGRVVAPVSNQVGEVAAGSAWENDWQA